MEYLLFCLRDVLPFGGDSSVDDCAKIRKKKKQNKYRTFFDLLSLHPISTTRRGTKKKITGKYQN